MREGCATAAVAELLSTARQAFDLVQSEPARADDIARRVLAAPSVRGEAKVIALWSLGRLAHDRGAMAEAIILLTEALTLSLDTRSTEMAADVRVSLAVCLQATGETDLALGELSAAHDELTQQGQTAGGDRSGVMGRVLSQRGLILHGQGNRELAIAAYGEALPHLTMSDDIAAARVISNRGVALMQLGDFDAAIADFDQSLEIAERLGVHVLAAGSAHNRAYLDGRLGRMSAALRGYSLARSLYSVADSPGRYINDLDIDECELLVEAGLAADAAPLAERVVLSARAGSNNSQLAEALLHLARIRMMQGEPIAAHDAAQEAVQLFDRGHRAAWSALAAYWSFVASTGADPEAPSPLRRLVALRRLVGELEDFGWVLESVEIRVSIGRLALDAGRIDLAREMLATAARARRHPFARVRAEAWHATALWRVAVGDVRGARRAISAGLRSVDEYRASVGATELRAGAAVIGMPLAQLGLQLAAGSSAVVLLRATERWRAVTIGSPTAGTSDRVPPSLLTDLRSARRELIEEQAAAADDTAPLVARVRELELAVGRASRASTSQSGVATVVDGFDPRMLRAALGDSSLVEFVVCGDRLHALLCTSDATRSTDLGPLSVIGTAVSHLMFALRRLAAVSAEGGAAERAMAALTAARVEVDELLFGSLRRRLGDGDLVVVPTGELHGLAWNALPTARRSRGITVAPSAAWWSRPRRAMPSDAVLLVAGPDLAHAEAEIVALARLYPEAEVLVGAAATIDAVTAGMSRASRVHMAAHGVFRADNPQFSALTLADGPLYVHDLESLTTLPDRVILSACSAGRSGVLPGDELLGTSAALMRLGVQAVVAPLIPIADAAAPIVAGLMHAGLSDRRGPAQSLVECADAAEREGHYAVLAAALAFNCFESRG